MPTQDKKLYLYSWDGTSLKEVAIFDKNRSAITAVAFSPDGKWLAVQWANRVEKSSSFRMKSAASR